MSTTYSNLGLTGGFEPCEDAVDSINSNVEKIDNLVLRGVGGLVATLPLSPVEGDAVILDGTKQVNVYSDGAWKSYTPKQGWSFINTDNNNLLIFDGSAWIEKPLPPSYAQFITGAGNLGLGAGVFAQINSGTAEFKTLFGGNGISITETGTEITIDSEFKTLVEGTGITLTESANEILIESDSPELTIKSPAKGTTFVIDPADPTDMYLVSAASSFPFSEIHLPDPALTPVGKQVIIKCRAVASYPNGITIKSETGAQYIEVGTSASTGGSGGFLTTDSVPMSVGMSVTYVNSGTQWLLINEVKSE